MKRLVVDRLGGRDGYVHRIFLLVHIVITYFSFLVCSLSGQPIVATSRPDAFVFEYEQLFFCTSCKSFQVNLKASISVDVSEVCIEGLRYSD